MPNTTSAFMDVSSKRQRKNKPIRSQFEMKKGDKKNPIQTPMKMEKKAGSLRQRKEKPATQELKISSKPGSLEPKEPNNEKPFHNDIEVVRDFCEDLKKKSLPKIKNEYTKKLVPYKTEGHTFDEFNSHPSMNRYKDIPCADKTRVVLKKETATDELTPSDYIHASIVNGVRCRYIAAQGPLANTINNHWRCVWQQNVVLIIMLCDIRENGRLKCVQYWPMTSGESMTCGAFTIKCVAVRELSIRSIDYLSEYTLEMTFSRTKTEFDTRFVRHVAWRGWPDKSVPFTGAVPIFICDNYLSRYPGRTVLIHCSAGIGRTGTLIALHMMIESLRVLKRVRAFSIAIQLREQRALSIQTELQYVYLYRAFIDYLLMQGDKYDFINESVSEFICAYEDIVGKPNSTDNHNEMFPKSIEGDRQTENKKSLKGKSDKTALNEDSNYKQGAIGQNAECDNCTDDGEEKVENKEKALPNVRPRNSNMFQAQSSNPNQLPPLPATGQGSTNIIIGNRVLKVMRPNVPPTS